ncbi:hypothetical protein [Lyngbya confervoides]|uniref:Uncharacterized protein n=1 Tax=Lyngbya confervoides BDU141951 TaxID=1574623 RepID=A0ABD4T102_9CYAN|nr:hypothetical protein [Lyngbya confervoides]MCM1982108.1 hypothetical protein [Lyngbya confervoides BDU141951]
MNASCHSAALVMEEGPLTVPHSPALIFPARPSWWVRNKGRSLTQQEKDWTDP